MILKVFLVGIFFICYLIIISILFNIFFFVLFKRVFYLLYEYNLVSELVLLVNLFLFYW